jgi:hypothetical protein
MSTVTESGLVDVVALGAALIALWLYVRMGSLGPRGPKQTLLHMGASFALLSAVPAFMTVIVGGSESPGRKFVALFLLAFPALVYAFLSIVWFMKMVQSMLRLR